MYRQRLEALLERKREQLISRDVCGLVDIYATPLPMYHPNGLNVAATAAELRHAFESIVAGLDAIGVSQVTTRVVETETTPGGGRFSAVVEIRYFDRTGHPLRQSKIRYFIQDGVKGLKIVMLEYLEAAFLEALEKMKVRVS